MHTRVHHFAKLSCMQSSYRSEAFVSLCEQMIIQRSISKQMILLNFFFFHAAYSVKLMEHSQGPCGLGMSKQQWVGENSHPGHFSGSVQFSSVTQSCLILCDPMDCSTTALPVHHQLPDLAQTHVQHVSDAIQPSHSLLSPSPPAFNLSQHQGLFQWVSSSHQVAKVLEFQLQHQSFQWTPRTDFL